MRNQPLLVSIVIGIIVIFVIVGASLVAKLSSANKDYKNELAKRMEVEEANQKLRGDIVALKKENKDLADAKTTLEGVIEGLKEELATAGIEIEKLRKIKEVFEDKLKEELMKEEGTIQQEEAVQQ